ncbi:hypothetical protein M8J77_013964 [Diaphorina citri]|nr:hypothetical protein M8J77_013964 [Diaphorina citri]
MSKKRKSSQKILPDSSELNFCPMCQIPLHFLKISGDMHLMRCEKNSWDQAQECPSGIDCFSSDFHHYWDFTHATLAQHRSLNLNTSKEDTIEDVKDSPKKAKASPRKKTTPSPKKKTKESQTNKRKHKETDNDSSDDDFKSTKPGTSKIKDIQTSSQTNRKDKSQPKRPKAEKARNKRKIFSTSEDDSCDSGVLFLNTQTPSIKPKTDTGSSIWAEPFGQSQETQENDNKEDGFVHFLYSNSQEMFSTPPETKHLVEVMSDHEQLDLDDQPNNDDMFKTEFTPTRYLGQDFKEEKTDISPMKFSSQEYSQLPTPTKYMTQNFKEIEGTSPEDYFKSQVKHEEISASQNSPHEMIQEPQLQFSESSDDDCEINSETGEILYTEKFEQDDSQSSKSSNEKQQVQDDPILLSEDIKKESKQVDTIEAWKKILSNRQQTGKSKVANTKPTSRYNEPTEARYTSTDRAPFYKLIPDTDFVVDGFKNGPVVNKNNYFLSHFHFDHYMGLKKNFSKTIHCSSITGELLKSIIKIDAKYIRVIDVGETKIINQVEVTALDANHCPGALMFVFKTLHGNSYLHTGDFRADESMQNIDILKNTYFDKVYLDTTYCDPRHTFPTQKIVIDNLVKTVEENHQKYPDTLYVCGSYTIGKEKLYSSILEKMKWKIYVESFKRKILNILKNDTINSSLVDNAHQAKLHVISMVKLNEIKHLKSYYESYKSKYDRLVVIKPTGWVYHERKTDSKINIKQITNNISVYEVPYSEHSSFIELCTFMKFLRYKQIVCTVKVQDNEKQVQMIETFMRKNLGNTKQATNTLNSYFKK